jgi:hypothetical protein
MPSINKLSLVARTHTYIYIYIHTYTLSIKLTLYIHTYIHHNKCIHQTKPRGSHSNANITYCHTNTKKPSKSKVKNNMQHKQKLPKAKYTRHPSTNKTFSKQNTQHSAHHRGSRNDIRRTLSQGLCLLTHLSFMDLGVNHLLPFHRGTVQLIEYLPSRRAAAPLTHQLF